MVSLSLVGGGRATRGPVGSGPLAGGGEPRSVLRRPGSRSRPATRGGRSSTGRRAGLRRAGPGAPPGARSATLEASRRRVEHRLAGEEPADRHAVQPADQLVARPSTRRCGPSRGGGAGRRRRGSRRRSSRGARSGSAHASVTRVERLVDGDPVAAGALAERTCDPQAVQREHRSGVGREPGQVALDLHGEQPGRGRRPGGCPVRDRRRWPRCPPRRGRGRRGSGTGSAVVRSARLRWDRPRGQR